MDAPLNIEDAESRSASPLRVLLVDDSDNDIALATALLTAHAGRSFSIVGCTDLQAAEHHALRGRFDVVLHGLRDEPYTYHRHLRQLIALLGPCPLVVSGEFWDEAQLDTLAELGVHNVLPKTGWDEHSLPHNLVLAAAQGRRRHTVGHDALTGLPTRSLWGERLQQALDRCRRGGAPFAVMLVDVDDFKVVNDTLGHEVGDAYLRVLADRLRGALRREDMVARLGGDEFAVLAHELNGAEPVQHIADQLIERVSAPVALLRATLPVSVSIGVAVVSVQQRRLTSDWVYQAADAALYQAKRAGKNRCSVYTEDMDRALLESLQIEDELIQAAQRGEFHLHYQPVVAIGDRGVVGFEALMRWEGNGRRPLSPTLFVPILERLGLMHGLGEAIVDSALAQIGEWRRASGSDLALHLNVSAVQLVDHQLAQRLAATAEMHEVPLSAIVLDISEGLLLQHAALVERELGPLRQKGLRLSVDDFGGGSQALQLLRHTCPDLVKFSRNFAAMPQQGGVERAIVRGLAVAVHGLGIRSVIKGVESEMQLQELNAAVGADLVQGFHCGRPGPPESAAQRLGVEAPSAATCRLRPVALRQPAGAG